MDYADLREAVEIYLKAQVPAVANRVFWSHTAPADTPKPFLEMAFLGELPSATPLGTMMQVEILCLGAESDILSLDPIADTVISALDGPQITTPDGRTITLEYWNDSRIDGWSEELRANVIRLKFILPTDAWR